MNLLRYGLPKREKPGLWDGQGAIRDLSQRIDDVSRNWASSSAPPPATSAKMTRSNLWRVVCLPTMCRRTRFCLDRLEALE
jgi:hypothetical protein